SGRAAATPRVREHLAPVGVDARAQALALVDVREADALLVRPPVRADEPHDAQHAAAVEDLERLRAEVVDARERLDAADPALVVPVERVTEHETVPEKDDVVPERIGPHCRDIDATRPGCEPRHPLQGYS